MTEVAPDYRRWCRTTPSTRTVQTQYQRVIGEEASIKAVIRDWRQGHIEIDWSPGYQRPLEWLGGTAGPPVAGLLRMAEAGGSAAPATACAGSRASGA